MSLSWEYIMHEEVRQLDSIFANLVMHPDRYSPFDSYDDFMIVEYKKRTSDWGDSEIELSKANTLIEVAKYNNLVPVFINKIETANGVKFKIFKIDPSNFTHVIHKAPETSHFRKRNMILKSFARFQDQDAWLIIDNGYVVNRKPMHLIE